MKKLIALLAVATLGGCAAYVPYGADPYYGGGAYYGAQAPYVVEQGPSVYIYGNSGYSRRGYYRNRDRDGDGVPNWRDAHPYDPGRR